jgi:sec-independent protein translocase protein TatA
MGQLGFSEMLIIFIVALLVFGPKKLPELGKSLGKGIREFKKATDELKSNWDEQVKDIKSPLNDVKNDIHNVGQELKSDFYKSIESESTDVPKAPAAETHETSHPAESTVPKEHV